MARKRWSRSFKLRLALVVFLLLGLVGVRYGWPSRSWETTVCPLEEIGWEEAARLNSGCIDPGSVSGARGVQLAEGSLDEGGRSVFDIPRAWMTEPAVGPIRTEILPKLHLPDLAGKRFRAGVFWLDMPAEYEGEPADALDPAAAYAVLLMCDASKQWEEAAELIVDLNRNRDLSDDPVMAISDVWSHEDENTDAKLNWFVRVFEPVELRRSTTEQGAPDVMPATARALPAINVCYYEGVQEPDRLHLAFCPAFFRRGRLADGDVMREVVVAPDRTRFGRFDGPTPECLPVGGGWHPRSMLTAWRFDRGAFWGATLDAEGHELRDGPYEGPTGMLRVETAAGEPLKIARFRLWLRGKDPRAIESNGWAPVPRFGSFTLPVTDHVLPVGDYGIARLVVVGEHGAVVIDTPGHPSIPSPREFSIQGGETTRFHLPKLLEFQAYAVVESRPRPYTIEAVWSSEDDASEDALAKDESAEWKGPRPGCEVTLSVEISDPATGNRYAIYPTSGTPREAIRVVIKDEAGKTVHGGNMEYG